MPGRLPLRLVAMAALLQPCQSPWRPIHPAPAPTVTRARPRPCRKSGNWTYPNLGSHLDQLAARVEEGEATAQDAASDAPVHSGGSVAVTIYLSGNGDEVVKFLEDNGGDPRNVGEDYIEAYVPVSLLGTGVGAGGGAAGAGNRAAPAQPALPSRSLATASADTPFGWPGTRQDTPAGVSR